MRREQYLSQKYPQQQVLIRTVEEARHDGPVDVAEIFHRHALRLDSRILKVRGAFASTIPPNRRSCRGPFARASVRRRLRIARAAIKRDLRRLPGSVKFRRAVVHFLLLRFTAPTRARRNRKLTGASVSAPLTSAAWRKS
jgi:hypothetical protein